jgi:hypothetical protein
MKNEQILEAALAAKQFDGLFVGKVVELPKSTLVCVDRSHFRFGESTILSRYDLNIVRDNNYLSSSVSIKDSEIILTKWVNMIDKDGDIHRCKIESCAKMSNNIYQLIDSVEDIYWSLYIQL